MNLYPAIDLKDGKCVRLKQGKFDDIKVYFEKPYEAAIFFKNQGAEFLHVVDLDGALKKASETSDVNDEAIRRIVESTDLKVEVGGGIRTLEDIEYKLSLGIYRVIIGTKAVENPDFVRKAIEKFGAEHIVVGIDAIHGKVATHGWETVSDVYAWDLGLEMKKIGVKTIIYTDISKDGMLTGPSLSETKKMVDVTGLDIIASGGVSSLKDLENISNIGAEGAIMGKSLYEGKFELKEAVALFSK